MDKSILEYIKKIEKKEYGKCTDCGGKMKKENGETCSKCKFKKCEVGECTKYLKKDSKFKVCYDCNVKISKYFKGI